MSKHDLIVTKGDGVPLPDQKAALEEFKQQCLSSSAPACSAMNSERIKEIQKSTAYPESQSVAKALHQVWHEVAQTMSEMEYEDFDDLPEGEQKMIRDHYAEQASSYNSDLLAIEEAPNNTTIWVWVETDEEQWFWSLAEKNGDDWVGVTAWDEHPNHNSFDDYGWKVLGWKKLEQPEAPQAG